jgi:hypothetical protein
MRKRIPALKRAALALLTVVVAFAWTNTGRAQNAAPCLIERGQDPLDVLQNAVRHNVWLIVDTSGSMDDGSPLSKLEQAQSVILRLMDELVDAAGRPLVNWGFVNYGPNSANRNTRCPAIPPAQDDNGDTYPDNPGASPPDRTGIGCVGLQDTSFVQPGSCTLDSRPQVRQVVNGLQPAGSTPIGIAFTELASYMVGDGLTAGNRTNFVQGLLANQRNYIIHLTDGVDTCECTQGGYPGVASGTLQTPVSMRDSETDPDATCLTGGGCQPQTDADDYASYNAGLKGEAALKMIDPQLDGSKGNIFTIGFDLNTPEERRRISTIAWMASGANLVPQRARTLINAPYFARSGSDDLITAFRDILARIGVPQTEVTLGPSVIGTVAEVVPSHTDPAVSTQDVFPLDLSDAEDIRQARVVRADHRDNVLFTTSVEVPGFRGHLRATNIYSVTDPLLPRSAREGDFTEIWDAGVELRDDDPDARVLYFNKRGSTNLLPFNTANVTPADLGVAAGYLSDIDGTGARSPNDARDIVVNVMRGYRLSVDSTTGTLYNASGALNFSRLDENGDPTWKLYESTSGGVSVVSNPPRSPDFDPPQAHTDEYGVGGSTAGDGFYWDHFNRETLVFYTSNAGILHAFAGRTGAERWGYIPDDAVGLDPAETPGSRDTLKDFVRLVVGNNNGVINHKFTLSGLPNAEDAFLRQDHGGDDEWHTLLSFGRGRGGRFITVLDVTNPVNPLLRWNRGNREGIAEGPLDGLGETWSVPVLGNVNTRINPSTLDTRVDQWLVFAGGGYGCDNNQEEGQFLFAFRAEDGFIHFRGQVTNDASAPIDNNALPATPTLYRPHQLDPSDSNDFVTRVYIPDVQGRVWKLDSSRPDPGQWTLGVFAEMGLDQSITASVTLMKDIFQPNRVFVMTGSGGDRRAPVPPGGFKFRTWIDADAEGANTTQFLANDLPLFEQVFNTEERMFVPAVTAGRIGDTLAPVVFFAASRETLAVATCEIGFQSTLYALGIESGLPLFDLDDTQPGTGQASLGEGKVQGSTTRGRGLLLTMDKKTVDYRNDGDFSDDPAPPGVGQFTLQLLVEGFRISPF